MTAIAIGGPVEKPHRDNLDDAQIGGHARLSIRYPVLARREGFSTYKMQFAPLRLSPVVAPTDDGFVAEVPELGVLGYGSHLDDALDELRDAVRDYLTIVRDSGANLAPAVAHHAAYLPLLDVPEESWLAAVALMPRRTDAADVG
jgi:hypothetical protein